LTVYPLAVAGFACIVALLWLSFRQWFVRLVCVLLLLPVGLILASSLTSFIMLMGMFAFPHASGRLTPTVTWRTDWTSMSFTSVWVAYTLYRNPRWLPIVKQEVIENRCFTEEIVDGNPAFRAISDGNGVVVSCRQSDGTVTDALTRMR
jgi:hypothetical protein